MIKTYRIEVLAILSSILLSLWLIYSDPVINIDAILYLESAEALANGDWNGAVKYYPWPFYSALIAAVHSIAQVDFDIAAYIVNSLLCSVLTFAFVAIVREFGASNKTLWFAFIFILALPSLNSYRAYIVRDFGFWAFYLLGLWAFFRFQHSANLRNALCWGAAMTIATLFRIEGLVFLTVLPAIVFWRPAAGWRTALRQFAQLHAVLVVAAIAAAAWFSAQGESAFTGRLLEPLTWLHRFAAQLSQGLEAKAEVMRNGLLKTFAENFAFPSIISIILLMLVTSVVKATSWLGIGASIYARMTHAVPLDPPIRRSVIAVLVINLVVLVVFITSQFFVSQRYALSMALTLGLFAPYGLSRLHDRWQAGRAAGSKRNWGYPLAILLLAIAVGDSLWSIRPSKQYIKDAGLWLRDNTPTDARILSRSSVLGYYADKSTYNWRISGKPDRVFYRPENLRRYDYVGLIVRGKDPVPPMFSKATPVQEFSNRANDRVLIFKAADLLKK